MGCQELPGVSRAAPGLPGAAGAAKLSAARGGGSGCGAGAIGGLFGTRLDGNAGTVENAMLELDGGGGGGGGGGFATSMLYDSVPLLVVPYCWCQAVRAHKAVELSVQPKGRCTQGAEALEGLLERCRT